MEYILALREKLKHIYEEYFSTKQILNFCHSLKASLAQLFHYIAFHVTPFWLQLCYFLFFSIVGFLMLKVIKPRTPYKLNDLDLFFTSVSATTVSSMSTLELEVFSNGQLLVITVLMLIGSEIFTSLVFLQLYRYKISASEDATRNHNDSPNRSSIYNNHPTNQTPQGSEAIIELGTINGIPPPLGRDKVLLPTKLFTRSDEQTLRYNSIKCLGYVVLDFFIVGLLIGTTLISLYISITPSAKNVLKNKGLFLQTFSIFASVSTFTNGGFVPTNENMVVFRKNSGLLLILAPFILLGNTLFAPCLRLIIYVLERLTRKKEYSYMLNNYGEMGYEHLKSNVMSCFQAATTLSLLLLQFVMFSIMEWNSGVMEGMNGYEKFVGSIFQAINSRHSGEVIVDLSAVSHVTLVLFVVVMFLPTYTSFIPIEKQPKNNINQGSKRKKIVDNFLFSHLAYLAIFVMIICMTESKDLKTDPLNFNVINIVVEVVSGYGNVGFSTGYSCKRRLNMERSCEDKMYGFVGRWSKGGKFVLVLVMFFGRLKKFSTHGGKAWMLSV